MYSFDSLNLRKISDCRPFSDFKTLTGCRSFSHSVKKNLANIQPSWPHTCSMILKAETSLCSSQDCAKTYQRHYPFLAMGVCNEVSSFSSLEITMVGHLSKGKKDWINKCIIYLVSFPLGALTTINNMKKMRATYLYPACFVFCGG